MKINAVYEIMKFIYHNHGSSECTKEALIKKFGEEEFEDFNRFSMAGFALCDFDGFTSLMQMVYTSYIEKMKKIQDNFKLGS